MINSILEQRTRLDEGYKLRLVIPKSEYTLVYGEDINIENAKEIVHNYLQYRDDDGEPLNVKISTNDDTVEIDLDLNYIGYGHKDYDVRTKYFWLSVNDLTPYW